MPFPFGAAFFAGAAVFFAGAYRPSESSSSSANESCAASWSSISSSETSRFCEKNERQMFCFGRGAHHPLTHLGLLCLGGFVVVLRLELGHGRLLLVHELDRECEERARRSAKRLSGHECLRSWRTSASMSSSLMFLARALALNDLSVSATKLDRGTGRGQSQFSLGPWTRPTDSLMAPFVPFSTKFSTASASALAGRTLSSCAWR